MFAFLGLFLPVIALYLLKQRRRRMQVATLMFWDKILRDEQTVTSLARLKKLLSLLLQLLFITLLTLALARPLLSGDLTATRRLVVFVDTSASMLVKEGEGTRFELARQKALDLVKGLAQGDTMMLVTVDQATEVILPFTNRKRDLEDAINSLEARHHATDFKPALSMLDQLKASESVTQVYLVTDGAFPSIDYTPESEFEFAYVKVGEASGNVGITAFQVRPLPDSAQDFQILYEVSNTSDQAITAPVELHIGGALVDAYEVNVPANDSIGRIIRQFSDQGGAVELFVDFEDAFPLDNRAFGLLAPPAPIRVQLVMDANFFLESALMTDNNVALEVAAPDAIQPYADYDVTIFAGTAPETTPPGDVMFIHQWPEDLGIRSVGELEAPLITDWDREHPINRHLSFQNISMTAAKKVEMPDSFRALVSAFDDPLLMLREKENGTALVVAFDPLASDLPLRVAFPMMVANAIRYLQGQGGSDAWLNPEAGRVFAKADLQSRLQARPVLEGLSLERVAGPDGALVDMEKEDSLIPLNRAGFYKVLEEVDESGLSEEVVEHSLFAVNLASKSETNITPGETIPIVSEQPLKEITGGFRLGFEPWFFVAMVAAFLLITEWILFHRRIIE